MSKVRYRYRNEGHESRSMTHEAIIERLATGRLPDTVEVQVTDDEWFSIRSHPAFVSYFKIGTGEHQSLKEREKAHKNSLRNKDIKKWTRNGLAICVSLLLIAISYQAFQYGWFNIKYDPFVDSYENSEPLPSELRENLSSEKPTMERSALIEEAKTAISLADPERMSRVMLQLERQIYHTPQDEDAVFFFMLIRSLTWEQVWPDDRWMSWLNRTTIRVDKLARLEAWVALRRGFREQLVSAIEECQPDDAVCQSALWIYDGDLEAAESEAQKNGGFAWRAVLDIVNNLERVDKHQILAEKLAMQWPESDIPTRLRADLAMSQGDWSAAIKELDGIDLNDNASLGWALRLCLMESQYNKALSLVPIENVTDHNNLLLLGSAALQVNKPSEEIIEKAIEAGAGVKGQLLLVRAHIANRDVEAARGLYARHAIKVHEPSERFYAVYLGALLRNFRTAGQLLVDFPTTEPEYWLLALHVAVVREGPQQVLEAIEGLVQTDVSLLWAPQIENAWLPKLDTKGMTEAAKRQLKSLRDITYAYKLVDWGLNQPKRHESVLGLNLASVSVSSARAIAALEKGQYELSVSESDVALRFESNKAWVSTIKALALLKAGALGRGESAMDAIMDRGESRTNARLLSEGASIRGMDDKVKSLDALVAKVLPHRFFMERWPQHIHHQLNEL